MTFSSETDRALTTRALTAQTEGRVPGLVAGVARDLAARGLGTLKPLAVTPVAGEGAGGLGARPLAAVHVQRQADDDGVRLPFLDQRFHPVPVRHAVLRLQYAQLAGLAGHRLADGDADLPGAVVEAQQQAQRLVAGHQA